LAQLSSDREDAARVAVLSVAQNGFWLWLRRRTFLVWVLGIAMVGWMIIRGTTILVAWCIYILLMSSSLILRVFLVLTWRRGVALCTTIRWVDIAAGWMPVISGYFVVRSYCLRFPLSKVWRVSLVG
jgi:hypothetical protein